MKTLKKEKISELFYHFEEAKMHLDGIECWSARILMPLLGYSSWQNFTNVVEKAKQSAKNVGISGPDHFIDVIKMIELPKGHSERLTISQ